MESRRLGRCAVQERKQRAFLVMHGHVTVYSPSFTDTRRLLALAAAAEDVDGMVVLEGGSV